MVYVIKGSEDGVYKVVGSYRKAYEACMIYVHGTVTVRHAPSFKNFKASLKRTGSAYIENHVLDCQALRMEVE